MMNGASTAPAPVPAPTRELRDRVVVVTGAGRGLGRAFALAFAGAGARVVAADLDLESAAETAGLAIDAGGGAIAVQVDVSSADSTLAMAAATLDAFGAIDVLVNNAGVYAGLRRAPFWELSEDEWDRVMAVNLKGPWLCARACLPAMRERGGGAIVNVSSATVFSGSPDWAHYVASKGAVIAMTRVMAREAGDHGIRVNALAPGFTLTEASRALIEDADSYGVARGAIKRGAEPQDIVGAAVFLASDASAFITGQTLVVDGGRQFI
jgi:NAD(P)-dependent dehydrogenase (short-subunit alcohol dehydrogenase family)